jgi:hypothetical protein
MAPHTFYRGSGPTTFYRGLGHGTAVPVSVIAIILVLAAFAAILAAWRIRIARSSGG